MCPIGLAIFFTFMSIAEGGGKKALKRKFIEVLPPSNFARVDERVIFLH